MKHKKLNKIRMYNEFKLIIHIQWMSVNFTLFLSSLLFLMCLSYNIKDNFCLFLLILTYYLRLVLYLSFYCLRFDLYFSYYFYLLPSLIYYYNLYLLNMFILIHTHASEEHICVNYNRLFDFLSIWSEFYS